MYATRQNRTAKSHGMVVLSPTEHPADGMGQAGVGSVLSRRARRTLWLGGVLVLATAAICAVTMHRLTTVELVGIESDSSTQGMSSRVEAGDAEGTQLESPARFESLSWADELQLQPGYLPPKDLFVFWGKSSFKGHGPLGRASSAERVREVLHLGHFTGNSYIDYQHGASAGPLSPSCHPCPLHPLPSLA
eukprot:3938292-Rhodomonas_salina.3